MAVTIRDIRVICTAPEGINLVVVKVETSEPGLYEASSGWKKCREYRRFVAVDEPERILEKRPY